MLKTPPLSAEDTRIAGPIRGAAPNVTNPATSPGTGPIAAVGSAAASSFRAAQPVAGRVSRSVWLIRTAPQSPRRPVTAGAVQAISIARLQRVPAKIDKPRSRTSSTNPATIVIAQKLKAAASCPRRRASTIRRRYGRQLDRSGVRALMEHSP